MPGDGLSSFSARLWVRWPSLRKFWLSFTHTSPDMYTLIGVGVGLAYLFSLAALFVPGVFPDEFRPIIAAITPRND